MPVSKRLTTRLGCLLLTVLLAGLGNPSQAEAGKTLASEALATAIATETLDEVKEAMMMDLHQKQRYEFDESGMERLGRTLVAGGEIETGIEILEINQLVHSQSAAAAVALADGHSAAGNEIQARIYYEMAAGIDPGNEAAAQAMAKQGDASTLAAGALADAEMDPAAMQEAMAQMGVEIPPEQLAEMQEAMQQLEAYQQDPNTMRAAESQRAAAREQAAPEPTSTAAAEPKHESEFCEVLHRFSADKRIPDASIRQRVEGHYGAAGDSLRTWNVETVCGDFLVAVPLWADVSPPVMTMVGSDSFEDSMGGRWVFKVSETGSVEGVTYTPADSASTAMNRLGDPKSLQ